MADLTHVVALDNITGLAYDDTRGLLYLTTSNAFYAWNPQTTSVTFGTGFSTTLSGLDLTTDGDYALLATGGVLNANTNLVERVDLATFAVEQVGLAYPSGVNVGGLSSIATASNGDAFAATGAGGGGYPLAQFPAEAASPIAAVSTPVTGSTAMGLGPQELVISSDQHNDLLFIDRPNERVEVYDPGLGQVVRSWSSIAANGKADLNESAQMAAVIEAGQTYSEGVPGSNPYSMGGYYTWSHAELLNYATGAETTLNLNGGEAVGVKFTTGGHQLMVWDAGASELDVYDVLSGDQVGAIPLDLSVGYNPTVFDGVSGAMTLSSDGRLLFLASGPDAASPTGSAPGFEQLDLAARMSLSVRGDASHKTLFGSVGSDTLTAGAPDTTFTGGGGADLFEMFSRPGAAVITDFSHADGDRIALNDPGLHSLADVMAASVQSGSNTVITLDGGSLTLDGVTRTSLTAADFVFGAHPAASDVNGDGYSDLVLRNTATGDWGYATLDASNTQTWRAAGPAETDYVAVAVGDFDASGSAEVAFRNATGDWGFMSSTSSGGETWRDVGASPLTYSVLGAGDFNGDGVSDLAFRDNATGQWGYMSMDAQGRQTWVRMDDIAPTYQVVALGDFNGDGTTDLALLDRATGDWGYLAVNGASQSWHPIGALPAGYTVIGAGDFNGDGQADLALWQASTGQWGYLTQNGAQETWVPAGQASTAYQVAGVGDFNGDGLADIAFWTPSSGSWGYMSATPYSGQLNGHEIWTQVQGAAQSPAWAPAVPTTPAAPAAPSDYNGDGVSDLLFRNDATGDWGYMALSGALSGTQESWRAMGVSSTDYALVGKGDFNGDGVTDVAFRNNTTGDWGYMTPSASGETWTAVGPSSPSYSVIGTGDFNGDGVTDVAFRNNATGDWGYMALDRAGHETWTPQGPTSTGYTAVGTGDFTGDGVTDVVFRNNTTGDWGYMAPSVAGETWHPIGPSSTSYAVIGTGDFNGDGVADVAFRNNTTGDWGYMALNSSGSGYAWHAVGGSSPQYSAVATGDFNGDGVWDVAFRNNADGSWGYMALNSSGAGETWNAVGAASPNYHAY